MSAGEYAVPYLHKSRTLASADTFGEHAEVQTGEFGYLWGTIAEGVAAQTDERYRSDVLQVSGTIRLQNYPEVGPKDQLVDPDETVWTVVTAYAGRNETVCEVTA